MTLFSQRMGIRPIQKSIQREMMDDELRNSLWSAIQISILDNWTLAPGSVNDQIRRGLIILIKSLWTNYFKLPIDTIPDFDLHRSADLHINIRQYFFKAKWWAAYDFIEFIVKNVPETWSENLIHHVNYFLEVENAAYRIVSKEIVEITDENEIAEIEAAIGNKTSATKSHLQRSLELLSDRKDRDYRNSIKEAISAVEATCQKVAGMSATLSDCLKIINAKNKLHPAFDKAFQKLYGYTSDEGGIRHALTEDSIPPTFADAKFMLVACSAFCNYVMTKVSELGIGIANNCDN